ncbi:SUKH-3 domain-containing protein [Kribbella sp. NPDC051137]|uniref:SUKH-3 domain-containing protein n=1 Tax=Kribbella sp. NPDC051137 TaxID=3155045 RepID=UPI00342B5B48
MGAKDLLRRAGWRPGRHVDVDSMIGELESAGHVLVPPARNFLSEFSGLTIHSEDGRKSVRIDGHDAARRADVGWCLAYAEGIGRSVTPAGEYSHMTLMIDEAGVFWGGYDDLYGLMGDDIIDLVDELLIGPALRQLDREVSN